jgi:eukaryotic-like serine/threonine-protein kinase
MSSITIDERYELLSQLGQGGMGQIWEAFDHSLRRAVAIKLMVSKHLDSRIARARFSREAMAIAAIQSPQVVQIFDAGVHGNSPYIVMERLVGEDLQSRLSRVERLSLSALVPIVTQVAKALEVANARNIVHRDLKPANIFLERTVTGEELVKLLDFGVAAILAASDDDDPDNFDLSLNNELVGTPHYMSPEQVRAGYVDHRSDLWSLAVLTYQALTGVRPFHSGHFGSLLVSICADSFVPVTTLVPELPASVDAFFNKAFAKDPEKRFSSASEFGSAFASLLYSVTGSAKILVTDDEPDVSTIVQKRFRKQIQEKKYQFVFAVDGENALQMLRDHPDIEVVLTDINMPRMDGLTFLSHLHDVNPLARAVVVSAYSELSNIRTAMNRGAFDFLVKPIDFKDLAATIDKTLKHVGEIRKALLSNEENAFLRMSVTPRALEKNHLGAAPSSPESWPCTIAVIGIGSEADEADIADPKDYVRMLNSNLEIIIPTVLRRGGLIDRFVGRSVITIFRGDDHLQHCLDVCCEIRAQLGKLARHTGNHSPFAVGIHVGIMAGEVIAAEIGSRAFERIEHTIFGEILKSAKRLHAVAAKNQILVPETIADASHDTFEFRSVPRSDSMPEIQLQELLGRVGSRPANEIERTNDPSGIRLVRDELPTRAEGSST